MPRLTLLATLCLATPAVAGVVSRDLFEPGDGLLTYDAVNDREWLDFSVSAFLSESRLIAELGHEGRLEGFQFATVDDVFGLALSANVHWLDESGEALISNTDYDPNLLPLVDNIFLATGGLFGRLEIAGGRVATLSGREFAGTRFDGTWVFLTQVGGDPIPGALNRPATTLPIEIFHIGRHHPIDTDGTLFAPTQIYWLYRDAAQIPEPATAYLALAGCLAA